MVLFFWWTTNISFYLFFYVCICGTHTHTHIRNKRKKVSIWLLFLFFYQKKKKNIESHLTVEISIRVIVQASNSVFVQSINLNTTNKRMAEKKKLIFFLFQFLVTHTKKTGSHKSGQKKKNLAQLSFIFRNISR